MDEASPAILLSRLKELQDLLQSPGGVLQERRVQTLSMFIARRAPNLSIRALAMQVMAEAAKLRRGEHALCTPPGEQAGQQDGGTGFIHPIRNPPMMEQALRLLRKDCGHPRRGLVATSNRYTSVPRQKSRRVAALSLQFLFGDRRVSLDSLCVVLEVYQGREQMRWHAGRAFGPALQIVNLHIEDSRKSLVTPKKSTRPDIVVASISRSSHLPVTLLKEPAPNFAPDPLGRPFGFPETPGSNGMAIVQGLMPAMRHPNSLKTTPT
jgi:hypothetical protein